ncbi:hypothetical protein ACEWY4_010192 [Coilia grayii]|uniref:Reverse transcriptase/retrotransposon-derived protein RNase H-like domain-containing protein n=1 Tax=Coilia grayii TaxID=363190 RepID=A0ABD1K8K3_9TELE
MDEANYLGYTVGRGNVKPQMKKVDAIATWLQPRTKHQMRTFLGLVGYYQHFVPNFASLASPLHELTRKGAPNSVKWTEQVDHAFRTLREALCSETMLHALDFNKRFVLQTDASEAGWMVEQIDTSLVSIHFTNTTGACLSQRTVPCGDFFARTP